MNDELPCLDLLEATPAIPRGLMAEILTGLCITCAEGIIRGPARRRRCVIGPLRVASDHGFFGD